MKIDFDNPKHETLVNNYEALCKRFNKKGIFSFRAGKIFFGEKLKILLLD